MKICVIGAPSTGKSVFARELAAEMARQNMHCDLVPEFASAYIQKAGAPLVAWEQLVISVGQHLTEQETLKDHIITDASAFATYIYAQRIIPEMTNDEEWPKYRELLDVIRSMARVSVTSYDVIFLMTHIFPPQHDGVRLNEHLSEKTCKEIGLDIEKYLKAERVQYHKFKANDSKAIDKAMKVIQQQLVIG